MANILGFVGIGVSVFALVCALVAISSRHWETTELSAGGLTAKLNIGLWYYCQEVSGTKTCTKVDDESSISDDDMVKVNVCRAMVFIGLFSTVAAIVSGVLVMFVLKSQKILFFVASGLGIFAGLCFMIAMAVYLGEIKSDDTDLHAGFAMDVLAWIVAWAAGGIFIGAKIMDKEE